MTQQETGDELPAEDVAARRSRLPALAEIAAYVVTLALVMAPGILHARTQIFGAGDDARYYTWLGWRIGRLIAHGHVVPTHISDVISPFGLDIRVLDGYLPSYVNGLFNLVCGPYLAINLTFLTGAILNLFAARSLAKRVNGSRLVHTVTAIAFVTAAPIALNVQLGLLPLYWAFTVPLLVGDAIDVVTGRSGVRPLRLALLLTVAYLCSVYFLVFGGIAYGTIVLVAAVRARNVRIPLRVAGGVALAAVFLSPIIVARVQFDHREAQHGGSTLLLSDSEVFSSDLLSIVAQPTRSTLLAPRPSAVADAIQRLPDPTYALEETIYPGLILLAGFVVFVWQRDRRRLPLVIATAVLFVLALGPSLKIGGRFVWEHSGKPVSFLPFRWLLSVPALGSLRVPVRVGRILTVVLLACTAIALDRLVQRRLVRASVIAAVCAVLIATSLLIPLPTTTLKVSAETKRGLQEVARTRRPGDTLLRVPFDCEPSFASLQILHHAPVVGCTGSFAANPWRSKMTAYTDSGALTKLRCDRSAYGRLPTTGTAALPPLDAFDLARLRRDFGVRYAVVDRGLAGAFCPGVAQSLPFLESHRVVSRDDHYEVLDLAPATGGG